MKKIKNVKQGFTLLELLVVVLIIGILASIALPQYQMAVTKAKVASILPIMRRWKDALYEYKLQHGDYKETDGSILGATWPSDWKQDNGVTPCGDNNDCKNDYWNHCIASEEAMGEVCCLNDNFSICMFQADTPDCEICPDKIICTADNDEGHKVCKALGGKLAEEDGGEYILY